ncbi:MAG: phosphatidylglycerophosphatase A [Pyrinomonadaceae bacterium]
MENSPSLIQQTDSEFAENQQVVEKAFIKAKKSPLDYLALTLATCGVGYIKLAPGTWGSLVGVGLYLIWRYFGAAVLQIGLASGWRTDQLEAWRIELNILAVLLISAVGIWAAGRAALLMNKKDPQQVVIDEVAGQFIALMFIPFNVAWWMILAGFLLFRFFDILKPYPIDGMQELPGGFGVVVDDLVAGIYAAIVMSIIVAIQISLT